jgi:glycerol uptake facilitator protein
VEETFSGLQRGVAEAVGTALLVFVGAGSVPAILLLEGGSKAPFSGADLGFISMAFGLIVIAMVYTVGKISGCHINPAVTFALAVTGKFPWKDVPLYLGSQIVGGIAGGMAIWAAFGGRAVDLGYGFGVTNFDRAVTSWGSAMFAEGIGTAILMLTILGIVDSRSPAGWAGLVIGLVIVGIIITVGPITNASLNPARSIGTLFTADVAGGVHNWTKQLLAYIPANLIGATFAVVLYDWMAKPKQVLRPIREGIDRIPAEEVTV